MQSSLDVTILTSIQKSLVEQLSHVKKIKRIKLTLNGLLYFSLAGIVGFVFTFLLFIITHFKVFIVFASGLSIFIPLVAFLQILKNKIYKYSCKVNPTSLKEDIINYVDPSFWDRFYYLAKGLSKEECVKYLTHLINNQQVLYLIDRLGIDNQVLGKLIGKFIDEYFSEKQADCLHLLARSLYIGFSGVIETKSLWLQPSFEFLGLLSALGVIDELVTYNVYYDDIKMGAVLQNLHIYLHEKSRLISDIVYFRPNGLLDNWFTGFTFYIGQFTRDLMQDVKQASNSYIFYKHSVINQLVQVLLKPASPYALLVGDPGVGKTSSVYALAQLMLEKQLSEPLNSRRILQIDVNKFLSSMGNYNNPADFLKYLEQELKQGPDVILYIDELERIMQDQNYHGLLLGLFPLLDRYKVPLIGSINTQFYNLLKKANPNLLAYFDVIQVPEADKQETYGILLTKIATVENKYKIYVQLPAIRVLIDLVKQYIPAERLPKSAVNLFDKVCVYSATTPTKVVDIKAVHAVLEQIIGSKVAVDSKSFATKIITLQEQIHKKYINQEEAVKSISNALVRNFAQLSDKKKPIGTFLFLGTTGVGKTYLAKIVSSILFGENYQIIRVDLGQYKLVSDIPQVLELLSKIRLSPASLVLLDEFEKANPQLHDIFLRLFDEGVLQDPNTGENLYFNNSLIVATSNVGSHAILEQLGAINNPKQAEEIFKSVKQQVLAELFNTFKPELLNRFDSIIVFKPLSKTHLKQIAKLAFKELEKELLNQGIKLKYNQDLINFVVDKAYNPALGARPIKRFIEQVIKSAIASYIVTYKAKHGMPPQVVDLTKITGDISN